MSLARVITFLSSSPTTGQSTCVFNIAAILNRRGKNVLIIDLDLKSKYYKLNLFNKLSKLESPNPLCLYRLFHMTKVLCMNDGSSTNLKYDYLNLLKKYFKTIINTYDHILIDCSDDKLLTPLYQMIDYVCINYDPDKYCNDLVLQQLTRFSKIASVSNKTHLVCAIFNKYNDQLLNHKHNLVIFMSAIKHDYLLITLPFLNELTHFSYKSIIYSKNFIWDDYTMQLDTLVDLFV